MCHPGVVDGGLDPGCADRRGGAPLARDALLLHMHPVLSVQHQASHEGACRVQVTGEDHCGNEEVVALLGLVDEDVAAHAWRAEDGHSGSPSVSSHIFVDESKERGYLLVAAVILSGDLSDTVQDSAKPGSPTVRMAAGLTS